MSRTKSQIHLSEEVERNGYGPGEDGFYFPVRIHDYNGDIYYAQLSHRQISDILSTAIKTQRRREMRKVAGNIILCVILGLAMLLFACPEMAQSGQKSPVFREDWAAAELDLSEDLFAEEWLRLPGEIQCVLIHMRYQLGPRQFRRLECMLASVRVKDWAWMALEMQKSKWSKWSPERAAYLIEKVNSVKVGCDGSF